MVSNRENVSRRRFIRLSAMAAGATAAAGCGSSAQSATGEGDLEASVTQYLSRVIQEGDLDAVDELCRPDVVYESVGSVRTTGPDAVKARLRDWLSGFSERQIEELRLASDAGAVGVAMRYSARHTGAFRGAAQTGAQVSISANMLYVFDGARVAEIFVQKDYEELNGTIGLWAAVADYRPSDGPDDCLGCAWVALSPEGSTGAVCRVFRHEIDGAHVCANFRGS